MIFTLPSQSRLRNLCVNTLLFISTLLVSPRTIRAQSSSNAGSASHNASCVIDKSLPTPADVAFFRYDYKKAAELYAAAFKSDPTDRRSRELEIDSQLGQGNIDTAVKEVEAWTTADPQDAYAILTAGEVRRHEGDWPEAYALMIKALKIDPCLPAAYQGMGDYESAAGYRLTARKHLAMAHALAPNLDDLTLDWIGSLDQKERYDQFSQFLQESKSLDDKRRESLSKLLAHEDALTQNHCELSSLTGPARIPMTPVYGPVDISYYGLEVSFNGHKRVLQIDTGASGFLLTHSAAGGLGLNKIEDSRVGGFGGQGPTDTTLASAGSVHIGGLEFKSCLVTSLNNFGVMGGSKEMGERLDARDGLIGADVFDRYLVTLDYIKHEIRLDPLPQPPSGGGPAPLLDALGGRTDVDWMNVDRFIPASMQSWTKIYRRGHELIMPTRINQGLPALFVIDTGSAMNLVDNRAARQVTKQTDSMTLIRGMSGISRVGETGKFVADFAGLRLPVNGMNSMDFSHSGGIGGFLGYPTLQQLIMHLDSRDNLVLFDAPGATRIGNP